MGVYGRCDTSSHTRMGELRREQAPAANAPRNGVAVPANLPKCPACACGQKTTLRAPRWRSSQALCVFKKDQSGSAADWWSPESGDEEDDGRPDHLQGLAT